MLFSFPSKGHREKMFFHLPPNIIFFQGPPSLELFIGHQVGVFPCFPLHFSFKIMNFDNLVLNF